jgi:glutamate-1-semialdehyde 2,1-aminomutase
MLAEAVRRAARDHNVPCVVQGIGAMFQVIFTPDGRPLRHYRDLGRADMRKFAAFTQSLLNDRILINSSGSACWFISASHTDDDLQCTAEAIDRAIHSVA